MHVKVRCSYHFPIVLELGKDGHKLGAPFKYNPCQYEEEDFQILVGDNWRHYEEGLGEIASVQFASTLRPVKEKVAQWVGERHKKRDLLLKGVEKELDLVHSDHFTRKFRQYMLERTTSL